MPPGGGGGDDGYGEGGAAAPRPDRGEDRAEDVEDGRELAALHDGDDEEEGTGEDGNNAEYVPAWIKGGVPHPGHVVQSTAMAVTEPPPLTYRTRLPRRLLESGALSLLQVEAALYCMQMHEKRLPTGERASWMLGDGTGIGKGRILSAIMYENMLRGRDRAVWMTASPFLANQIRRDVKDIGLPMRILELKDHKLARNPNLSGLGPGIMICTYRTLIRAETAGKVTRMGQLISWLGGEDWDGVLALDEAHLAKNLGSADAKRKPSQTAVTIDRLQKALRHARVVYASATIATGPENLQCLSRLGLWGPGTAFPDSELFVKAMKDAGLQGLELMSVNMKQEGKYMARTLGFKGCSFQIVKAPVSPAFATDVYDACARQWEELRKDLRLLVPKGGGGGGGQGGGRRRKRNRRRWRAGEDADEDEDEDEQPLTPEEEALQKGRWQIWLLFWSTHQRFFKSLYVAAKLPFLLTQAREALAQGYAPIIGLMTTGESHIKGQLDGNAQRVADKEEDGMTVEEISQCRGVMESFLKTHVKEASLGRGAQAIQDRHLAWLEAIGPRLPPNPLDELIQGLGGHKVVAEMTGRTIRKVNGRYQEGATSQRTHEQERTAFQRGEKQVAVISDAASVGISLHSDRREPTAHKRRVHFVLELAWGADKVMQQLGRSHRTNQQTGPIYKFIVTEQVGADVRFISTVARRLQSLGAITQGHEGAANTAMDLREYNVWSSHGDTALLRLRRLQTEDPLLLRALQMMQETENEGKDTKSFLNRCLGYELNIQNVLLRSFFDIFNQVVSEAKMDGTYENAGITNLRGEALDVQRVETFRVLPPAVPVVPPPQQEQQGAGVAAIDVKGEGEEAKESFVSLVTLTVDRGIPYDHAEQMLLLADAGEEGRWGGNGFYMRRDTGRPFLALDRGDGHAFKVLYPDVGRQAYVDISADALIHQQFLTPKEAEAPWTARYGASVRHCLPHQRANCCNQGVRLHTAYLLTFDTVRHWKLVQEIAQRRRLRIIRATTTSEPRKSYAGVMLTSRTFRRVARHPGLVAVPEPEGVEAVKQEEDKRVDVLSLLEERAGGGGGVKAEQALPDDTDVHGIEPVPVKGEAEGKEEEEEEEEEEGDIIDLSSDTDDDEDADDDASTPPSSSDKPLARKYEDEEDFENEVDMLQELGITSDAVPKPEKGGGEARRARRQIEEDEEEDEDEDEDEIQVVGSPFAPKPAVTPKKSNQSVEVIDVSGSDEVEEMTAASGDSGGGGDSGTGSVAGEKMDEEGEGGGFDEEEQLLEDILDMLDELRDEEVISKTEAKALRARAIKKDPLVTEAFHEASECRNLYTGGTTFRRIALGK